MFGKLIQIIVVSGSLLTNALLASKNYRRWGYLVGLINLACWAVMETYYGQWFMLGSNIIYLFIWVRGLQNHFFNRKEN